MEITEYGRNMMATEELAEDLEEISEAAAAQGRTESEVRLAVATFAAIVLCSHPDKDKNPSTSCTDAELTHFMNSHAAEISKAVCETASRWGKTVV